MIEKQPAGPKFRRIAATASDSVLRALREVALEAGYDGATVEEARRRRAFLPAEQALPATLREQDGSEALGVLLSLFALGSSVSRMAAKRALGRVALHDLADAGLLELGDGEVRSRVQLASHDGMILAGDGRGANPRDFVGALFGSAGLMSALTPRGRRGSMLDLCTGSGVHALLASRHCDGVIGTDINPRALAYAEMNARINGASNVDWRLGSWLEPVADERFDLILANPPDLVSPDDELTYRDSGMPAGAVIAQLCRDVPAHLNDDGLAVLCARWPHSSPEDWDHAPAAWAAASRCDTIVICLETADPLDDAVRWNSPPSRGLEPAAFRDTVARWQRYHRKIGAGAVSFGVVVLRRRSGSSPWALTRRATRGVGRQAARQIERVIVGNDLLASGEDLLARRYVVPDGLSVSRQYLRSGASWRARSATVNVPGELGISVQIDYDALDVLFRCDGRTPLLELTQDHPRGALSVSAVSELLAHGLIEAA